MYKLIQTQKLLCMSQKEQRTLMRSGVRRCLQCDNSGIFCSSLAPKSRCLCHSLARRGQPCIMSALTAVQLCRIQPLDESKAAKSHAGCVFKSPGIKWSCEWLNPCRSMSGSTTEPCEIWFWRRFCVIRFALSCLKLYVRPCTCLVLRCVPKCER